MIQEQETDQEVSVTPAFARANALDGDFGDVDMSDEEVSFR